MAGARAALVVGVVVMATMAAAEDPILPDIWKVVEDSYDSTVTINFPSLDTTMLVDELYDITGEQGMVEVRSHGITTTNNYYTLSGQSFLVEGTMCAAGTLLMEDNFKIWGWKYDNSESSDGKINFLYGPSALLRIPRDYGKEATFMGEESVRGIMAYHFLIEHNSGHTLSYYFASDQWLMPYGHVMDGIELKAPLMVKVYGPQGNPWNVEEGDFNQTVYYEYTDFKPYVKPERRHRFLVREGLECKNRESLDPEQLEPPTAPYQFQVFLETVVRPRGTSIMTAPVVFRSWVYYSKWMQLMRIDINPGQDAVEPTSAYKSIHDYNTGIDYRIDMTSGECVMRALDPYQFGNQIGSSVIGGIVMADPDNLFHLDEQYMFNGYSETRGIKTSRWTAVRNDVYNPETGENFKKVVVDYQFNSKDVRTEGEADQTVMPVRVDTTVYYDNDTSKVYFRDTVNLLHMQTSFQEYDFNPFHVGECMDLPTERTWIKITFAGDWMYGASQEPGAFKKKLVEYVVDTTQSSFVRFPEVQLDHDTSDLVYATMLVLENAPYSLQFEKLEDREPTVNDAKINVNIHDEDACAYVCLSYTKFVCKSFYKCKGDGKTCYVSNYKNSAGNPLTTGPCPHYNKALLNSGPVQKPNLEVEAILEEKILTGDFAIEMDYTDNDGNPQTGTYQAIAEQTELLGDDPVFVDLIRDDFYPAYRRGKLLNKYTDLKLTKVSYTACLAKCLGQVSFECETFSYCYNSQECMLTSEVVDAPPDDNQLTQQADCVIIVRAHTNDYTPTTGFVYLGEPKEVHTTLGVEKCAYLCDNATDFTCRSFDFCLDNVKCNLYDHHTADEPDNMFNESKACLHYSRNALVDFTEHPNQMIQGTRDRYIKDTTTSACAQVCEDEPDFGCNGFDFCKEEGSGVTCFLTEDHYSDSGTQISDSLTCDHYSRDYYEGMSRDEYAHTKKDSKYKYGPGDMAGLGCSMLVISIGLTFAGVYVYNKHYKN